VIHADGELDLTTVPVLAQSLVETCRSDGSPFLIVDMTEVSFMDGRALYPLCSAWRDCTARQGWLRLVYTSSAVALVLRAATLSSRFPRYATVEDARRGLAAHGPPPGRAGAHRRP
jgi:anti-anti-sigma factor